MKIRVIIESTFACFAVLGILQSAVSAQVSVDAKTDSVAAPVRYKEQQGTAQLQEAVLTRINESLFNGSLIPGTASQFKAALNKVNEQESWYKSFSSEIPADLTEKDTAVLNEMNKLLNAKPAVSAHAENALHDDIDELISAALAKNQITSNEAERYYLRLAQIESNLENVKKSPAGADSNQVNSNLLQMKAELLKK